MRESSITINQAKEVVKSLQGKCVEMIINRGRNKLVTINATIDKIYPSMFIIKPDDDIKLERTSFSYSDLLCGDIKFLVDNM